MTVSAAVIAEELARARRSSKPIVRAPARAIPATEPKVVPPARAKVETSSRDAAPARSDLHTIRLLGRTLDDLEKLRIQNGLRVGAARDSGIDAPWAEQIDGGLRAVEDAAELELVRAWRRLDHPAVAWAKAIPGAGETLMARLFAEIGDPGERAIGHWEKSERPDGKTRRVWVIDSYEERTKSQLRAFCGHGDPARARPVASPTQEELFKRGNPNAKKATWKLAYQFMRTVGTPVSASEATTPTLLAPRRAPRSPYRDIYDTRKADTEGKLHKASCVRCGPAGHPALPGSPWSLAHRHADALRIVGKEFLNDLWVASRANVHTWNQNRDAREAQS